jgi:hypothetical protein
MPNGPSLLLVREVADLLRTSTKAVYAMIERRALPGVYSGHHERPFRAS